MTDTSRYLPPFDPCSITRPQALRLYREALGEALVEAQEGLTSLAADIRAALRGLQVAQKTVDALLAQNPDADTPNSLAGLVAALGGFSPSSQADALEERVAEMFDLNVVGGVLFPQGSADLGGMRRLFASLEITESSCDLPDLDQDFIFVTAYTETTETVVGASCGEPIVEYAVTERKIGENISVQRAADLRAIPASDVLLRFFWLGEAKTDRATQIRLKALGITGDNLSTVITAPQETTSVFSTIIDTSQLTKLQQRLTDTEICRMMQRDDTRSGLNLEPTADDVIRTIRSTLNTNTGANRNRGGTDEDAITPAGAQAVNTPSGEQTGTGGAQPKAPDGVAPAGRAGDPALIFLATVNLPRSLDVVVQDGGVLIGGTPIDLDGVPEGCTEIFNFVYESMAALQQFAGQAQTVFADIFGQLTTTLNNISAGVDFSSCLVSVNLGLKAGLDLAAQLPLDMETFLTALDVALTGASEAIGLIKKLLCLPQAVISMLFGGICGFKPFNFDSCPPDILQAIERLKTLLNIVSTLVSAALAAFQVIKADARAIERSSLQLKVDSECASAATPLGIALGLLGGETPTLGVTAQGAGQTTGVTTI